MKNFPEKFAYVVTDNWQKISVNITNSPWSDRAEIDFLADRVLAQGYEIIMEGLRNTPKNKGRKTPFLLCPNYVSARLSATC